MEMWTQENEFSLYFWTEISQQNSARNWKMAMKIAERTWIHFFADAFTTVFLVVS